MAIRLEFEFADPASLVADGYVNLKIERDDGEGGGYVEISRETIRPPLRDVVNKYVFQDPTGDVTWDYQAIPLLADGTEHITPVAASTIEEDTYTTLATIRAEGVSSDDVDDARVNEYIAIADQYIEDITENWFNPRYQIIQLTGDDNHRLFLDIPIIAVQKITIDGVEESLSSLVVNNRYLRNGLLSPDDRKNPMITYSEGLLVEEGVRLYTLGGGVFPSRRQEIKVWGVFGFTELSRGEVAGEVVAGSQVPISYGTVPKLIKWAAKEIVINRCFPSLSDESLQALMRNRITRHKTRDQEVEFSDQNESEITGTNGFTNSTAIDQILARFKRPMKFRFV